MTVAPSSVTHESTIGEAVPVPTRRIPIIPIVGWISPAISTIAASTGYRAGWHDSTQYRYGDNQSRNYQQFFHDSPPVVSNAGSAFALTRLLENKSANHTCQANMQFCE